MSRCEAAIAGPLVKRVFDVDLTDQIHGAVTGAYELAQAGEPGPVIVQIAAEALAGTAQTSERAAALAAGQPAAPVTPCIRG